MLASQRAVSPCLVAACFQRGGTNGAGGFACSGAKLLHAVVAFDNINVVVEPGYGCCGWPRHLSSETGSILQELGAYFRSWEHQACTLSSASAGKLQPNVLGPNTACSRKVSVVCCKCCLFALNAWQGWGPNLQSSPGADRK